MDDSKWERWAVWGGILFVVMTALTIVLPGTPPSPTDSARKMVDFFSDKGDQMRLCGYIALLSLIPFFWWLGSVWRLLRRTEGGSPRLTVVAFAGALFAAATGPTSVVMLGAIPIMGVGNLGPGGVRGFYILGTMIGIAGIMGLAVFIGSFSILILRTRMLANFMGWFGVLIALVAVVGGAAVDTTCDAVWGVTFAGFLGGLLWVLIISILMLRKPVETVSAA